MNRPNPQFATTQWTLVWKAAEEDSQHGRPALTEVIRRYWQPLYHFARRQGLSSEDAEDATQEFLSRVMSGQLLENADPAKGKFRTFLLSAWRRFLIDEYRKRGAARRGGGLQQISIDFGTGERSWKELESREPDAERLFMLTWANSILDDVRQRLKAEYQSKERTRVLEALLPKITQTMEAADYSKLASELSLSLGAVKVAMHRLRQRFGVTIREVISETVEHQSDIDAEIGELLRILTGK